VVVEEQLVNVQRPCLKAVQVDRVAAFQDRHYNLPAQVAVLVMRAVPDYWGAEPEEEVAERRPLVKAPMAETADLGQLPPLSVLQLLAPLVLVRCPLGQFILPAAAALVCGLPKAPLPVVSAVVVVIPVQPRVVHLVLPTPGAVVVAETRDSTSPLRKMVEPVVVELP